MPHGHDGPQTSLWKGTPQGHPKRLFSPGAGTRGHPAHAGTLWTSPRPGSHSLGTISSAITMQDGAGGRQEHPEVPVALGG